MNPFHRLFGKKPKNQDTAIPEQTLDLQAKQKFQTHESALQSKPIPESESHEIDFGKGVSTVNQKSPKDKPDAEIQPENGNAIWRTFSIFISSTFTDMQAERDYLKNKVFPRVEEELQKRRIKLEIVDLRWGIDTTSMEQEDEREANVLKVCLDEIRRCRPFFIGLLGDRYGWVPPVKRMQDALVGEDHIKPEEGKSVTDLEIEFGVLASKEQLVRSVFYFQNPLPYASFPKEKAALFSDAHNQNLSEAEKAARKIALEKLKAKIVLHFETQKLKDKVKTYTAKWDEATNKVTGLEAWGDMVYTDILEECKSHAKETWEQVPKNWQEQELALLNAFIEQHTHITTTVKDGRSLKVPTFCGREDLLKELKKHLLSDGPGNWGLVLTGESGSGKSAVFSMVTKMMQQENCFILAHSAGLSPRAKKVADFLQIWNKQLADHLGIKEELNDVTKADDDFASRLAGEQGKETTTPIEKLQEKFLELLQKVSAEKRVVLLIDALDRFEPTARAQHLSWLPSPMPQNVRLLCTAITGTEKKATQYHNGLIDKSLEVLSPQEASEMLLSLSQKQHKTLPGKVENILLEKKRSDGQLATASPLWLSLAVNLLMAIDQDDFEKMSRLEGRGDQQIETYLVHMATAFDSLPGPLFISLTEKAGEIFGKNFSEAVFNYIAISRNGLREKDLEKLLPENIWDPLQFAGLRRWFKAHLVLQGEELQWNLAHSILRNTLSGNTDPANVKRLHDSIATYLIGLQQEDPLQISETMYHLMLADNKEMAANWYGSFWWNETQTAGSSKTLAEAMITDEAKNRNDLLEWVISLTRFADLKNLNPRAISYNFILSLFDKNLKDNYNIPSCIRLVQTAKNRMEELCHQAPNSAEYSRDLALSYNRLGELYLQMGDIPKALEKFQTSLTIAEQLRNWASDSVDYARDLSVTYNRMGDLYLLLADHPKALAKYHASLIILEELHHRAPASVNYASGLSILYDSLGELYLQLGDTPQAFDKFQASLAIRDELCREAPDSADYARALSVSYDRLGKLFLELGDTLKALDKFQASLAIREKLRREAPDSAENARDLSVSYDKLGDIYLKLGDTSKALDKYKGFLVIALELYRKAPDSAVYARDLSISYDKLSSIYLKLGDLSKALSNCQTSLTISKELYQGSPEVAEYASGLAVSYDLLGDLYLQLGDPPKALSNYQASLTIREKIRQRAPDSADYAKDLSISYDNMGDLHLQLGDPPKALSNYQASLSIREELRDKIPDSADHARNLSLSYDRMGDLYLQFGDTPKALDNYQASLAIREELRSRTPESAVYVRDTMISYEKIGTFSTQIGDIAKAKENIEEALNLSIELHQHDPDSAEYSRDLSRYHTLMGDLYLTLGDPPKALSNYQASLTIAEELHHQTPDSAKYARDVAVNCYRIMILCEEQNNHQYFVKYSKLCEEALLFMKKRGMFMDEQLVILLNWFENN